MNAALFKEDVQRAKHNIKDTKHQKFIKDIHLHTTDPKKTLIGNTLSVIEQTVAKTAESLTYSDQSPSAQGYHP